jgi:hypothetical protein
MMPQMFTPITNSQSPGGTSTILVPCIGTPALLQAMWSLPKLRHRMRRGRSQVIRESAPEISTYQRLLSIPLWSKGSGGALSQARTWVAHHRSSMA